MGSQRRGNSSLTFVFFLGVKLMVCRALVIPLFFSLTLGVLFSQICPLFQSITSSLLKSGYTKTLRKENSIYSMHSGITTISNPACLIIALHSSPLPPVQVVEIVLCSSSEITFSLYDCLMYKWLKNKLFLCFWGTNAKSQSVNVVYRSWQLVPISDQNFHLIKLSTKSKDPVSIKFAVNVNSS